MFRFPLQPKWDLTYDRITIKLVLQSRKLALQPLFFTLTCHMLPCHTVSDLHTMLLTQPVSKLNYDLWLPTINIQKVIQSSSHCQLPITGFYFPLPSNNKVPHSSTHYKLRFYQIPCPFHVILILETLNILHPVKFPLANRSSCIPLR